MAKGNFVCAVLVVLSCVAAVPAVTAAPIAPGDGQQTISLAGAPMTVFTYRPPNCSDPSLLLVFHGVARNARTYRDYARPLADRNCLILVAPLFDRRDFPGWRYQRGGIVGDGVVQPPSDWSGNLVPALVEWVRQQEGRPVAYSLLGHSAGGQFLERLAAFVPTQARRIVVANPGSYVFPSLEIAAPYGLGKVYAGAEGEARLRRYLALPLTIYVGAADTREHRDDSPEARAQGASRHQRGMNVFDAARKLA
jgi:dienelactone hydrolase